MNKGKKVLKVLLFIILFGTLVFICTSKNETYAATTVTKQKSVKDLNIVVNNTKCHIYSGNPITASVKVYDGSTKLKVNQDYTLQYKNNVNPGRATAIVKGIGKYEGTYTGYFYIAPKKVVLKSVLFSADASRAEITWSKDTKAAGYKVYMAESKNGTFTRIKTIVDNNVTSYIKKGLNPNKKYYFRVRAFTVVDGVRYARQYSSSKTKTGLLKSVKNLKVVVNNTKCHIYSGNPITASVKVYDGSKKLKINKDYTLQYKNNVNPGRATAIVKGIGKYDGKYTGYFYIAPKKAVIESVIFSSDLKKATINWKKDTKAAGYKVYMAESKNGTYTRIKTIVDNGVTSYTKKGLDQNKVYYFKVRAFTVVDGVRYARQYSSPKTNTGLLTTVTLNSPTSGTNRNYNLKKACDIINGKVINPGETFNWFRDHGPASSARGFRDAIIFEGNRNVLGSGGGVCQVSTTIYQAANKIGLQMVERHTHSKAVSYTESGKDATVAYGSLNLIIRNNKKYPIKLVLSASGGKTTCKIYRVS